MRLHNRITMAIAFAGLAVGLMLGLLQAPAAAQAPTAGQAPAAAGRGQGGRGGGFNQATDPRVQNRTYRFEDTGEELPYCVFVSSKRSDSLRPCWRRPC